MKRGRIGLNQPLICIHPLPFRHNFLLASLHLGSQKSILRHEDIGGGGIYPLSPNYVYGGRYCRAWLFRDVCSFGPTNDDRDTRNGQESSGHLHDTRDKTFLLPVVTVYGTGVHHFDPESKVQ